jgi:hypothetical protein
MQFKSRLDADGGLRLSSGAADGLLSISNSTGDLVWGNTVRPSSSSTIGLVVKGVTSQSVSLQEWQISDGTVKTKIAPSGSLSTPVRLFIDTGDVRTTTSGIAWGSTAGVNLYSPNVNQLATDANLFTSLKMHVGSATAFPGGQAQVTVNTASDIGMIVKGAASQTGDLQQWQNSSAAILASVDSAGNLTAANQNFVNRAKWNID